MAGGLGSKCPMPIRQFLRDMTTPGFTRRKGISDLKDGWMKAGAGMFLDEGVTG